VTRHAAPADDRILAAGITLAGVGPLLVAALLVPFRDNVWVAANVTLVFVAIVVVAAAAGDRIAGVTAALVSVMAYDFFFTKPYQSLKIDQFQDVVTAVLLLGIGLTVAEVVGFARRARAATERRGRAVTSVGRVADLVAAGADAADVRRIAEEELIELLSLRGCRFEDVPSGERLPAIGTGGAVEGGRRRWVDGELSLPADGVELPVRGRGRDLGRMVLVPDWNVGISITDCVTARAIADQLGAALVAAPPAPREPGIEASGS
jgi:hypothetical protein